MKALFAIAALLVSFDASADFVKRCDQNDWSKLNQALDSYRVIKGAELKDDVVSLSQEEMGPECAVIIKTSIGPSIPGQETTRIVLRGSGERNFEITINENREETGNSISISKK